MAVFESMNAAIVDAVKALGGSKCADPMLWPEKTPEAAQRLILACLNEDRPEHLSPDQTLFIARAARAKGNLAILDYMLSECACSAPAPVEPESEIVALIREFNEGQAKANALGEKIERRLKSLKAA